jgi:hypothetical protein
MSNKNKKKVYLLSTLHQTLNHSNPNKKRPKGYNNPKLESNSQDLLSNSQDLLSNRSNLDIGDDRWGVIGDLRKGKGLDGGLGGVSDRALGEWVDGKMREYMRDGDMRDGDMKDEDEMLGCY